MLRYEADYRPEKGQDDESECDFNGSVHEHGHAVIVSPIERAVKKYENSGRVQCVRGIAPGAEVGIDPGVKLNAIQSAHQINGDN